MKFLFNLVLICILGCKSPTIILKEPNNTSKPGLIAFGLFIYDDISPTLFEKNAKFKLPEPTRTLFYALNQTRHELDLNSKIFIIPKPSGDNIEVSGKLYNEQDRIIIRNEYITYFLFSNLEEEKEFILGKTGYSFTTGRISVRGKRTNQINYVDIPLQLDDLSKILKFKVIPGKISFLGNFIIRVNLEEKGNFLGFNENRIGSIERIDLIPDSILAESLYGNEEISAIGAEKNFLKKLLMNSLEGYWREMATDRLAELLKN